MKLQHLYNWKIYFLLLFTFIQLNFENKVLAQAEHTGIIWVVPNRPDAFPVNGNRTGNSGLNLAFEDYHVIEYVFIDSLYFTEQIDLNGIPIKQPVYQIRLQEEYAHWELSMLHLLKDCYPGFFKDFAHPYYNTFSNGQTVTTDNGLIILEFENIFFNTTLLPRSNTRSNNKPMNLILQKYDIKSYSYRAFPPAFGEDTSYRIIKILCDYQDALPLFYDLFSIDYLYNYISIARSYIFGENYNPCGSYSYISTESESSINIFPNPAYDKITISGVTPESIIVYDVMGNRVMTEFDVEAKKISLKHLSSGLYVIMIITQDGKVITEKIIKQ